MGTKFEAWLLIDGSWRPLSDPNGVLRFDTRQEAEQRGWEHAQRISVRDVNVREWPATPETPTLGE